MPTRREDIITIRAWLEESVAEFGARFGRSGRTIEDWEQGRRKPDRLCQRLLDGLTAKCQKARKSAKSA